jgi:Fe-Mn family superoxide dismutase
MNSPESALFTRREAVGAIGAAAALVTLGLSTSTARAETSALSQPFTLPPLGYAYGALEPHIDARTMQIHYTKHHQAYITNANKALAAHPELHALTAEQMLRDLDVVPESVRAAVRNNVGGHFNHAFFWRIIAPNGGGEPRGALAAAIDRDFGSLAAMKKQFSEAALGRFGSGWAWLSAKGKRLIIHSTANQDCPLSEGAVPVIGLDVWEHAYYLKHQNVRADYVGAFWDVVNWPTAAANYEASAG